MTSSLKIKLIYKKTVLQCGNSLLFIVETQWN